MESFVLLIGRDEVCIQARQLLQKYSKSFLIQGSTNDLETGRELIRKTRPDLLILDIQLKGADAFSLIEKSSPQRFDTIFVSDNEDDVLRALRLNARDYLGNPIVETEFNTAIESYLSARDVGSISAAVKAYFRSLNDTKLLQVAVQTPMGLRFITLKNVIRFQKAGKRTMVFMKSGKKILISKSLCKLRRMMASTDFFRIGEFELVNLHEIIEYRKGRKPWVQMPGLRIPIPLKLVDKFTEAYLPIQLLRGKK